MRILETWLGGCCIAAISGTTLAPLLQAQTCRLTDAKFSAPFYGDTASNSRTLRTYVVPDDPANYPHLTKVFRHPHEQLVTLSRSPTSNCSFLPLFISMNSALVEARESGTSMTTKSVRTRAVPTAETSVEIRALWGDVTRRVYWVLRPAPPAPYAYIKTGGITTSNTQVGSIASFELYLIRKADPGGTRVHWKMSPPDAFKAVSGDVAYASDGSMNSMVVAAGNDIQRFKLEVLSRPSTGTAYLKTWVGNQNVSSRPEYLEKSFTIVVPRP